MCYKRTTLRDQLLVTAVPQLTVEDVAHYLRTDAATVTRWLEARALPGYRLPDRWLISADELADYLDTCKSGHRGVRSGPEIEGPPG